MRVLNPKAELRDAAAQATRHLREGFIEPLRRVIQSIERVAGMPCSDEQARELAKAMREQADAFRTLAMKSGFSKFETFMCQMESRLRKDLQKSREENGNGA